MRASVVVTTILMSLLISMLTLLSIVPMAKSTGTIRIRSDGSIDPPTAPIQQVGDLYAFTDNIFTSIVVNRDNITIDGKGYTVQGVGTGSGFDLSGKNNVTVRDTTVTNFDIGIYLNYSDGNTLYANVISSNIRYGIRLWFSSNNKLSNNTVTFNDHGINYGYSSGNTLSGNTLANNGLGIWLCYSVNNLLYGNIFMNNYYAIYNDYSSNNSIYSNNFVHNSYQHGYFDRPDKNNWDNGYFAGGNYWSDYNGTDVYSGPDQNETGSDGLGDTPYRIDPGNQDNYPLMGMFYDFIIPQKKEIRHVTTICNSTVTSFSFSHLLRQISFNITGPSNTTGFCKVTIPRDLIYGHFTVLIDGVIMRFGQTQNATHVSLFFTSTHASTTHQVQITATTIALSPRSGCSGTKVLVNGVGFCALACVSVTFNDMLIGYAAANDVGNLTFVFCVPTSEAGTHCVKAFDGANYADETFIVMDLAPMDVKVDAGTIHFRGELAVFHVLTTFKGEPVNVTVLNAVLYKPDGTTGVLTAEWVTIGLYEIGYTIAGNAETGTYTLVANSSFSTSTVQAHGSSFACFSLSPTLVGMNAMVESIRNEIATVVVRDLGAIQVNLTTIGATLDDLFLQVTAINGTTATIQTTLGLMNGTITSIEGNMATIVIQGLGEIKVDVSSIQRSQEASPILQIITLVLALIAAIGEILGMVFRRRKTVPTQYDTSRPDQSLQER